MQSKNIIINKFMTYYYIKNFFYQFPNDSHTFFSSKTNLPDSLPPHHMACDVNLVISIQNESLDMSVILMNLILTL